MANPLLELQKKFNLFKAGDKRQGIVCSVIDGAVQIKLKGGALGMIKSETNDFYSRQGINLKVGNVIEVEVSDIISGVPYLSLPMQYVFSNSYQKAEVKFSGTQAVVVEFPWLDMPNIGLYNPDNGVEPGFQVLDEGCKVICRGLQAVEDYYRVKELELDTEPEIEPEPETSAKEEDDDEIAEPSGFFIPAPWDEAKVLEFVKQDSLAQKGIYKLGEVYLAKCQANGSQVKFADGDWANIKRKNGLVPVDGENLLIRIIRLYAFGDFKDVEVLDIVNKDYVKYFKKIRPKNLLPENADPRHKKRTISYDCGFKFGERDNEIYKEGMKNKSEDHFEKYWLGFLYRALVKSSKPVFYDNNNAGIVVKLLENEDVFFVNGQIAFCRLHYIENKNGKVTFTVRVEGVREPKPEEKF